MSATYAEARELTAEEVERLAKPYESIYELEVIGWWFDDLEQVAAFVRAVREAK